MFIVELFSETLTSAYNILIYATFDHMHKWNFRRMKENFSFFLIPTFLTMATVDMY